jgi:hypothetical protein
MDRDHDFLSQSSLVACKVSVVCRVKHCKNSLELCRTEL